MNQREQLLEAFAHDRIYAHEILFAHRHKDETPEFHRQTLEAFYSPHPRVVEEAFRGGAKSTLIEEYLILQALYRSFHFAIVVGNSYSMACQRLASVKEELTNNDALLELFGDQHGPTWAEGEIVLACGVKMQALGARQSMRGVKHNDERPDLAVVDDLEDEEMVGTKEAILKNKRWFNGTLRPALNPKTGKIRMLGTPLHPEALIESLMTNPEWTALRFPIKYLDDGGAWQSTWPARFPVEWINKLEQDYINDGSHTEFMQEYMCQSESAASKPFKPDMMPMVTPAVKTWTSKCIMIDPARKGSAAASNRSRLARTGYACWSWIGTKLDVHEAFGAFHSPDEIIETTFKMDDEYRPTLIGVELDGLEEFLMQPYRNEMLKRAISLPLIGVRAPKNKDAFISGLQPFFIARDVRLCKPVPDLIAELLQFPIGRKDVPNALAFALRLRPGLPVYEDFEDRHVAEALYVNPKLPFFLCVSARAVMTAGVLLQYVNGGIRVIADWIREAPPMECLDDIIEEAQMTAGGKVKIYTPAEQFEKYNNFGLVAAARGKRYDLTCAGNARNLAGCLKPFLQKLIQGEQAFQVDMESRWVLNGMAGGYGRARGAAGTLQQLPEDNQYRLVIEAIEAFAGWFALMQNVGDTAQSPHYDVTADGRRFISTLPDRRAHGGRK